MRDGINRKINKIKERAYRLKNKFKHFFQQAEKFLLREMKEQDIRDAWKYLGTFKIEGNQEEYAKIFLLVFFMFLLSTLFTDANLILDRNFQSQHGMANAQAKEDSGLVVGENGGLSLDVELVNKYNLKSTQEICEKNKDQKKSSSLCGKDDEEAVQRISEQEKKEVRNQIARRKPVITARDPYVYERDGAGRKVCNRKNDHPSKSKDNKRGHMDMECCLDPDEVPNPHCYYSQSKYGKYLN